jgi:small subunit ribosomal protein S1
MKQVAINDIGTAEDFMAAIDQSMKSYQKGDVVPGTIVQIGRDGVLVDIGSKSEAFIPKNELSLTKDFNIFEITKIGQVVRGTVLSKDEEGNLILSLKEGKLEDLWDALQFKYEISDPVKGKIVKAVKGGLIVDIGTRAFLPGSLIELNRVDDISVYVGHEVEAIILQFDREKKNIVLSRRSLLEQVIKEDKNIEFAKVEVGQIYRGSISGITEYGVFVEIGLLSGLIHKSKMGEFTPEQFTVGHEVDVEISEIDFEKSRLSLAYRG